MPYTYKSLVFAWLIVAALFAVSASGAARGVWFAVLLTAAIVVPALVLRTRVDAAVVRRD